MVTLLILIVCAISIGVVIGVVTKSYFVGSLVSFALAFLTLFISVFWMTQKAMDGGDYVYSTTEIKSISHKSSSEGSFFIGSGTLKGKSYYVFYVQRDDGSYVLKRIRTCNAAIYQDSSNPHVTTIVGAKYSDFTFKPFTNCSMKIHDIHVPKGTIVEQFNLN